MEAICSSGHENPWVFCTARNIYAYILYNNNNNKRYDMNSFVSLFSMPGRPLVTYRLDGMGRAASPVTGQGPAYASVFVQDEDAQDEEMEIRRMHELVEQTTQVLQQARNELIALNQRQRSDSSASTEAPQRTCSP